MHTLFAIFPSPRTLLFCITFRGRILLLLGTKLLVTFMKRGSHEKDVLQFVLLTKIKRSKFIVKHTQMNGIFALGKTAKRVWTTSFKNLQLTNFILYLNEVTGENRHTRANVLFEHLFLCFRPTGRTQSG